MIDSTSKQIIGEVRQADYVDNENIEWNTPAAQPGTQGTISLSLNNREFFDIHLQGKDYSFEYYPSPVIDSIEPAFGEVRHSPDEVITVRGRNFDCQNQNNCKDLKCRFGEEPNFLTVKGTLIDSGTINCPMPNYPQPEILPVEVSMNGEDFSNDGIEFGFYDPFVLNVTPKLISKSGSTKVTVNGFGFVDTAK